jgi:thymidylate kinase
VLNIGTAVAVPHPTLARALRALDDALVEWCLLRGETELDAPVGDVDLLVSPRDAGRLAPVLTAAGYAGVPAWGHGSHRFFVAYAGGIWIKLDVVTEMSFGPSQSLQTRAAPGCLARRRRVGVVNLLDPDDAFWCLLLHCLLDRGAVPPRHAERLVELAPAARSDGQLTNEIRPYLPPGWDAARLVDHIRRQQWAQLALVGRGLQTSWRRQRPLAAARRRVGHRVLRRLAFLAPLAGNGRGRSVALLGLDGAGKSTLARSLRDSFYFPARALYASPTPRRVVRLPLPGLGLAERLLRLWGKSLTVGWHKARGRLVVLDRYVYDALLPPPPGYGLRARVNHWVLSRAAPATDLVVLLDVPAEVAHQRKREHTVAWMAERRQHYLELSRRLPQLRVVDAARAPEPVLWEVTALVWRCYARAGAAGRSAS